MHETDMCCGLKLLLMDNCWLNCEIGVDSAIRWAYVISEHVLANWKSSLTHESDMYIASMILLYRYTTSTIRFPTSKIGGPKWNYSGGSGGSTCCVSGHTIWLARWEWRHRGHWFATWDAGLSLIYPLSMLYDLSMDLLLCSLKTFAVPPCFNHLYHVISAGFIDSTETMCKIFHRPSSLPWWSICPPRSCWEILSSFTSVSWGLHVRTYRHY